MAVPAILLQVSLENPEPRVPRRANRVELIGCDARFWKLGNGGPRQLPGLGEIVLNRAAADRLGVRVGDDVLLRLPTLDAIPADSALGKKHETIRTQRVTVSDIIADAGLGTFSLRPTQRPPLNAYVSLDWLGQRLDRPGRANAIFTAGEHREQFAPGYSDYGLHVERTAAGYWNITSDRMMLDPATERGLLNGLHAMPERLDVQPAMTYLANTLACNGREVPYSTITAINFARQPPLGPFLSTDGKVLPPLGAHEIALNSWAADQLHARVGDTVRLTYFEPESLDGRVREKTVALRLAAIVELAGAAADRALTPSVKGVDRRTDDGRLGSAFSVRRPSGSDLSMKSIGIATGRRPRHSCRWRWAAACGAAASDKPRRFAWRLRERGQGSGSEVRASNISATGVASYNGSSIRRRWASRFNRFGASNWRRRRGRRRSASSFCV